MENLEMNTFEAREAVTFGIIPVRRNECPRQYQNKISSDISTFAVFSNIPQIKIKKNAKFLGLLSVDEGLQNLDRDFEKLLQSSRNGKCFTENTPLNDVVAYMQATQVEVVPVLGEDKRFIGIITPMSALQALTHRHQQLITSHRELQQTVRRLRRRNRVLYEQNPAMCWCLSRKGKILSVNPAAAMKLGYRVDDLVGQSVEIVVSPEVYPEYQSYLRHLINAPGEIICWETKRLVKDGSMLRVREHVRAVKGPKNLQVFVGVSEDLSEKQGAEKALVEAEQKYRNTLDAIADMVIVKDRRSKLLWANKAFREYYGMTEKELEGIVDAPFNQTEYTKGYILDDKKVLSTGEIVNIPREPVTRHDGVVRFFHTVKSPVFDPEGVASMLVAVCRDVTEKLAEEEKYRFSQFATDRASDEIYWMRPDASFIYVNDAACRNLGYDQNELLGMTVPDISPQFTRKQWPEFWQRLKKERTICLESVHRTKEGKLRNVEVRANFLKFEGKEFNCSMVRDISERKRIERQVSEQHRLLSFDAEVGKIVSANQALQPILQNCTEAMIRHLKGALARIWILNEGTGVLELQASAGMYTHLNGAHSHIPIGNWKIGQIAKNKKPMVSNELKGDLRISDPQWVEDNGLVSFAGYPLMRTGQISGVLALFSKNEMSSNMVTQLTTLSEYLSVVLERHASANELKSLVKQNELLLNSAGEGIYGLNREGFVTFVNPAAATMLGYTVEELIDVPMHQYIHHSKIDGSENREEQCGIYSAMKEGKVKRGENDILWRKDGTHFPIQYISTPIWDRNDVIGSVVVFQDITERLKSQEQLRKSEQWFRTIAESIPQQVWTAKPDGAIEYVNQRVLDYFGRSMNELQDWNWQSVVHPEDLPACLKKWGQALDSGEPYQIEFRLRRGRDEAYRWHLGRAEPLKNEKGEIVGWFGSNTDITERKEVETGLEQMAGQLKQRDQALIASIPDLVLSYDKQGIIVSMKPSTESNDWIVGDVIGKNIQDVFSQEMVSSISQHIQAALENHEVITAEFEVAIQNTQRFFEARYVQSGKNEVMSLIREITREKERMSQIKMHAEELERIVEERARIIKKLEVQRMQTEKLVALGQLAAGVAHEINNPLAGIKTSFSFLKELIPKEHPDYHFVPLMDESIHRMSIIVEDMYKLYGSKSNKWEDVDLHKLIENIKMLLRSSWLEKKIKITISTRGNATMYRLPEQELFQVLANLIQNGIDASPQGGEVRVEISQIDNMLQIEVKDQGVGIPSELGSRIFEPFFSSKGHAEEARMGLGLSVSRSLVEAIGGSLDFESIPQKETVFYLKVPLSTL